MSPLSVIHGANILSLLATHAAHIDFETASACELKPAGVHRYAEHPSTRTWGFRWCIAPRQTTPALSEMIAWVPGAPDPADLLAWIAAGGVVVAHNAIFERTIWNILLRWRYGLTHWPELRIEQQNCTMSRCAALAIPESLEIVAQVLHCTAQKDMEGSKVMMKMMRPRTRTMCVPCGGHGTVPFLYGQTVTCRYCLGTGETYTWWDDAWHVERNLQYCAQDVVTECEIDSKVPELSDRERRVWMHDQHVNDRGVMLDIPLIERAIKLREHAKKQLDADMHRVTGGAVPKATQVAKLVTWINSLGIECTSIAKDKREAILADADEELGDDLAFMLGEELLPNPVQRALAIRKQASKSSTSKLDAMLKCVSADGRARGLFAYHGTSTGRYAGRRIQPHNLYRVDPDRDGNDIRRTVELLLAHDNINDLHFLIDVLVGPPMEQLAKSLRGMFIAAPGMKLVGADLSNIEGRLAAWLADEKWKLDAFADYDNGNGADLYNISYARSFGVDVSVPKADKSKRQIGKVQELSLAYQGSVGAFINMGKNYGLKPADLVAPVRAAVPDYEWMNMQARFLSAPDKNRLPEDQWTAIKIIVQGWRSAQPQIVQTWYDCQDAAIDAVMHPGQIVYVMNGKGAYLCSGGFLWAQLPSGRVLAYCRPITVQRNEARIVYEDGRADYHIEDFDDDMRDFWKQMAQQDRGNLVVRTKRVVMYEGYEGETKRWGRFGLYGGMQFNHFDQGSARDVLVDAMFRCEDAGYPTVLHVHDECVGEVPVDFGSAREYEQLVAANPFWLPGCPLASKGWEGPRYGK